MMVSRLSSAAEVVGAHDGLSSSLARATLQGACSMCVHAPFDLRRLSERVGGPGRARTPSPNGEENRDDRTPDGAHRRSGSPTRPRLGPRRSESAPRQSRATLFDDEIDATLERRSLSLCQRAAAYARPRCLIRHRSSHSTLSDFRAHHTLLSFHFRLRIAHRRVTRHTPRCAARKRTRTRLASDPTLRVPTSTSRHWRDAPPSGTSRRSARRQRGAHDRSYKYNSHRRSGDRTHARSILPQVRRSPRIFSNIAALLPPPPLPRHAAPQKQKGRHEQTPRNVRCSCASEIQS